MIFKFDKFQSRVDFISAPAMGSNVSQVAGARGRDERCSLVFVLASRGRRRGGLHGEVIASNSLYIKGQVGVTGRRLRRPTLGAAGS